MSQPKQPWDRQPGEPNLWYDRFERFRLAGVSRSILSLYNAERKQKDKPTASTQPHPWNTTAATWRWRERAEAWDEHLREQKRREDQEKRDKELAKVRELRRTTVESMQALLGHVTTYQYEDARKQGKPHLDPKTLRELAQAMAIIFKESRLEFGEPTDITDVTSGGKSLARDVMELSDAELEHLVRSRQDRRVGSP
jgi:hypothetical protein